MLKCDGCIEDEQRIAALEMKLMSELTKKETPSEDLTLSKKEIRKRSLTEPTGDVIKAILIHPPRDEKDCREQQLSVRFAISTDKFDRIVGKITKLLTWTGFFAMIAALAPFLGGILGEIISVLLKYGLI